MSNASNIRHTLKQMYPNKGSIIERVRLNLNDDVTNIIKDIIFKSDSHYTYSAFKKKLGELIIEFYNTIVTLFNRERKYERDDIIYIYYNANKFHPEKGDFKKIYDIIVALFKNLKNSDFNVKKVSFGKRRKYFVIKLVSKNLEKSNLYLIVNYSYDEYIYKFKFQRFLGKNWLFQQKINYVPIYLTDVSNIIKNILVKTDSKYSYSDFKKKLGELIILFYNKILKIHYENDEDIEYYIKYDGSKFNPEQGDFKLLYDFIIALFKNYKNSNFNVRKVKFNRIQQYFIIQLISNDDRSPNIYILVSFRYDLTANLNNNTPFDPEYYDESEEYSYEFRLQNFMNINDVLNVIQEEIREIDRSQSIKSLSSKLSSTKSLLTKSSSR